MDTEQIHNDYHVKQIGLRHVRPPTKANASSMTPYFLPWCSANLIARIIQLCSNMQLQHLSLPSAVFVQSAEHKVKMDKNGYSCNAHT